MGRYILDFYCPSARLALEVDGATHDSPDQLRHDRNRDAWLAHRQVKVLRFLAADVLRNDGLEGIIAAIVQAAAPSGSLRSPPPPLRGGGSVEERIAEPY